MKRIVFFLFCLISIGLQAQEEPFSGSFSQTPFSEFVNQVEGRLPYRFYFQEKDVDSLKVNGSFANIPLREVLVKITEETAFEFSFHQNAIYVTKGRKIYTSLPPGFFGKDEMVKPEVAFDYSQFDRNEKLKKASEQVYVIGKPSGKLTGVATISGTIKDVKTGEPLIGASIFIENTSTGVTTDQFGRFELKLPKGKQKLIVKSLGMKITHRQVMLYSDGTLNVELEEDVVPLKEVLVKSDRDEQVSSVTMGVQKLDIKSMKQVPLALGETDVLKVITALPGVQTVGEGTLGLNVRGGSASQNLILFNDGFIYNPSHLFGFFSTFNPDVIKSVELYKSGITADYGGRLSSVLDVRSRDGNLKKFSASGGISPVTGRLTLEGPLIKDKTSILVGARSTYSDWLLKRVSDKSIQNSSGSFYDVNATISHQLNAKNNIFISGYWSGDQFKLNNDTVYNYKNKNASLRWKSIFNPKLYATFSASYSKYDYSIADLQNPLNAFKLDFSSGQIAGKADFNYFLNKKHTLSAGASMIRYEVESGHLNPQGDSSIVKKDDMQREQAYESSIYAGDNFEISPRLSVYYGLRYSMFHNVGPKTIYSYANGSPRQVDSITDTTQLAAGSTVANYGGLEPRFSVRYNLTPSSSVKLSYNRMRQYIQQLSNTTAISPTDIWKLSDAYVKPQIGDQYSIGYYKTWMGNLVETSIEAYYKTTENMLDYKNGAILFMNHHIETDIINGKGKSYGIEFLIKKSLGKLNGWFSYTYSRSLIQTIGQFPSETVNDGKYYPSNYDKPHSINFIGNYKFNRRINFSLNVIYSTGRPITLPIAKYDYGGVTRVYYSDRNQYRIPDYFRVDISFNIEGSHKIKKLAHSSWTFAVYNLLGRHNAYSIYFVNQFGTMKGYQLSIFAQPIPTITYNFRF